MKRLLAAKGVFVAASCLAVLTGCELHGEYRYADRPVNRASEAVFGTVISSQHVKIQDDDTGIGGVNGAVAGGIIGSQVGRGLAGGVAGVVAGAVVGATLEHALNSHVGIAYSITLENGTPVTVVQRQNDNDPVFAAGQRVMVQTNGLNRTVLDATGPAAQMATPPSVGSGKS